MAEKIGYVNINAPKGKTVYITVKGGSVSSVTGILDEDVTLQISSSFESIIPQIPKANFITKFGKVFGDLSGIKFSSQFKQMGFRSWVRTEPLSVNLSIGFYTVSDPYENVYKKVINLAKLALPYETTGGMLIGPGPSVQQVFFDEKEKKVNNKSQAKRRTLKSYKNVKAQRIDIRIGNIITLKNVIIEKAEPTFSTESAYVDPGVRSRLGLSDDQGLPIWARVNLDIKTVFSAYQGMLDNTAR